MIRCQNAPGFWCIGAFFEWREDTLHSDLELSHTTMIRCKMDQASGALMHFFSWNEKLKTARKLYRKCLQKEKRKCWQLFVQGHSDYKDVAHFNKILNKTSLDPMGLMKDQSGNTLTPMESTNLLAETHFPNCINTAPRRRKHKKHRWARGGDRGGCAPHEPKKYSPPHEAKNTTP